MTVPKKILELTENFNLHLNTYKRGKYNETMVRREFIDPLFKTLGWDINNEQGYAEAYKDVIHEDAIKVGQATKAPDYCFRIGGVRKFFLEAKKPSVDIKKEIHPAYQLRRYAWSARLPLSILTDFEEFAVYDCRVKPTKTDKASTARILYLTFDEYQQRWQEIADIFSREAILKGSFDKYVESTRTKKGTAEVDAAFLQEIERWRDMLARNIALRNTNLTQKELNFAVQRTIDRIIFLRICGDRGIEPYGNLMALLNGTQVYPRLCQLFYRADDRYNSGLFHFKQEKNRSEDSRDTLTTELNIDDKIIKDIVKNLYYPDSPYEFSVLPADILGQVYEQFLGKIISLTPGHRAKVEYKPEVRKAGGVYYTPTYIVDYIVKNTIGKLIEGKKPGPKGAVSKFKILDPACGSGSFLLGAYQFLLDWQRDEYIKDDPEKWAKGRTPQLYQNENGDWKLTTDERKRILLDNIYGVDIDTQAVEVTKLSLLLKVLEDESDQSIKRQITMFQQRVLPDLASNIKCGNSLIGNDFYQSRQLGLLDEDEMYRINAFDWDTEFAEIMENGGFDAVIGNPPYIRIQAMKEWAPLEVEIYKKYYSTAKKGNYDIYVIFAEQGLNLLNEQGFLGFILPNKFLATDYGKELRKLISEKHALSRLIDFGHQQVFEKVSTYTCLLFLSGSKSNSFQHICIKPNRLTKDVNYNTYKSNSVREEPWIFMEEIEVRIINKIFIGTNELIDLPTKISRGSSSGNDNVFMLNISLESNIYIDSNGKKIELEKSILKFPIFATDFNRYTFTPNNKKVIIFPYVKQNDNYNLIKENEFRKLFPKAYKYLRSCKKILEKRKQYKNWYSFSAPRNLAAHDKSQILVPLLADKGIFAEFSNNREHCCLMASGGFSISVSEHIPISSKYVLGLLNSKLLFWYLKSISNKFRGGWITCTKQYMGKLPIHIIDFDDLRDKSYYDQIVKLVKQMLNLHKQLSETKLPQSKTTLNRQIEATDREIDRLVYELYDLTDDEIRIVEDSFKN